jgi:hypothetical protein
MGGSLVFVFNRISPSIDQIANTQLFTCKQLVLVEISESVKTPEAPATKLAIIKTGDHLQPSLAIAKALEPTGIN